jgi:hypothetical protein
MRSPGAQIARGRLIRADETQIIPRDQRRSRRRPTTPGDWRRTVVAMFGATHKEVKMARECGAHDAVVAGVRPTRVANIAGAQFTARCGSLPGVPVALRHG